MHGKAEPQQQVYEPVFAIVGAGQNEIVLGETVFRGKPGSFMIVSVDLPITFQITEASRAQPYVALALTLRPAAVASLLLEAAAAETSPGEAAGMGAPLALALQ